MTINNIDLKEFGAEVEDGFEVGTASFSSGFQLDGGSTTPIGYSMKIKERPIKVPLAFMAATTDEAIMQKSRLLSMLCKGTVEIFDDENNVYYSAVLSEVSDEGVLMEGVYEVTLTFKGIMHGSLIKLVQKEPFMPIGYVEDGQDCKLSVTANTLESDGTFKIGGITFKPEAISAGAEIVINGFDKRVLVNGAPGAGMCDIISFPKMYPGKLNYFECKDPVTIEYYPVYK